MTIRFHRGDLPSLSGYGRIVAIDTETTGLNLSRDRLCLVQLSSGDGSADLVQISARQRKPKNLCRLLASPDIQKIYHYGRFDIAVLYHRFGVMSENNFCTKIASKLVRTNTDRHSLRDLCREFLDIDLPKQYQSSDWGAKHLSEQQKEYAAGDVIYLHAIHKKLVSRLKRERRDKLALSCFGFLPSRCLLDLSGWEGDIFEHS